MRILLCAVLAPTILLTLIAISHARQDFQEHGELRVLLYRDENNNHRLDDGDSTALPPACNLWLLNDVSNVHVASGVSLGGPGLENVARAEPESDGTARFELAPGRYSVAAADCFAAPPERIVQKCTLRGCADVPDLSPGCCPYVDGAPHMRTFHDADGNPKFQYQTVDVRSGETTSVTIRGHAEETPGDRILWYVAIGGTLVFVGLIAAGVALRKWREARWRTEAARGA